MRSSSTIHPDERQLSLVDELLSVLPQADFLSVNAYNSEDTPDETINFAMNSSYLARFSGSSLVHVLNSTVCSNKSCNLEIVRRVADSVSTFSISMTHLYLFQTLSFPEALPLTLFKRQTKLP
jgi:hypothetical protein